MRDIILEKFGFSPTSEQKTAIEMIAEFVMQRNGEEVMILRGFAGTGKTSVVGALVKTLDALNQQTVLLAPTGRAAKVFSQHASHPAFTIHKKIYRQKTFNGEMTDFQQGMNLLKDTLFIVDEASMISNDGMGESMFGTGRLLDDLIKFVYNGTGCRLLLVGDTAQLPPVGEEESPALSSEMLECYGLQVKEMTLTEVVRQAAKSGILMNATMLRQQLNDYDVFDWPRLKLEGFPDVQVVNGEELVEELEQSYQRCGRDETIVVTRSNARAKMYNHGIRNRILYAEFELDGGDQVMIVKNNYFWLKPEMLQDDETEKDQLGRSADFIANGDVAVVRNVRNEMEVYGFRFADVTLRFPDYDDLELTATVLLDTLQSEAPALTREQQQSLFNQVWEDYPEFTVKRERMKAVREDQFYNALQLKYAYAVTCHKAQGGQWQHVYVDQGYMTEEMLGPDYYRWLYTAITRATEKVFLIKG